MKAEDTVIKDEDIKDLWIPCETCHREPFWKSLDGAPECMECIAFKHRERQAEISFKIGKTAGVAESLNPTLKAIVASRSEGIKEVVAWVIDNYDDGLFLDELQVKCKEWGI